MEMTHSFFSIVVNPLELVKLLLQLLQARGGIAGWVT